MSIRTKIIATVGPERPLFDPYNQRSAEPVNYLDMITWFFEAGVNVFRLNMSHRSPDGEMENRFLDAYRECRYHWERQKKELAILGDLQGPKIRTGNFNGDPLSTISLKSGGEFTLHTRRAVDGNEDRVSVLYDNKPFADMTRQLSVGAQIWLGDGEALIEARDISTSEGVVKCGVLSGGEIRGGRGVTVKNVSFDLASFTNKDQEDLRLLLSFGAELTYVALSFIRSAEDILQVKCFIQDEYRKLLAQDKDISTRMPGLIAKIETPEAQSAARIEEILDVADGIMIARGDLGMQLDIEEVARIQKRIIHQCNVRGKPVITATQMLDSMERNPVPTRAEITDVYNAILDGTDAVMLSGETSKGPYPVQAIRMLANIAGKAEEDFFKLVNQEDRFLKLLHEAEKNLPLTRERVRQKKAAYGAQGTSPRPRYFQEYESACELLETQQMTDRVSHAACSLSAGVQAAAIMAPTSSGQTARMVARYRPELPIIGAAHNYFVARKLTLCFGVYPVNILDGYSSSEEVFEAGCACAKKVVVRSQPAGTAPPEPMPLVQTGALVVITAGYPLNMTGTTNLVKLHRVK